MTPFIDARLLVNLVSQPTRGMLLDPFAGASGVLIEAKLAGWVTVSLDNDRTLRFGLNQLADYHIVGSATALPLTDASVDAIASEPPYHPAALEIVMESISEMARVLRPGGRVSLLVASNQRQSIRQVAKQVGLILELDEQIDRKDTSVSCLCWKR